MRILSLLFLAACAGSTEPVPDVEAPTSGMDGIWETTHHTFNPVSCTVDGSDQLGDPYFRLATDGDTLRYYNCRAADDCNTEPDAVRSWQRTDDGWLLEERWSFLVDTPACALHYRLSSVEPTDVGVALRSSTWLLYGPDQGAEPCQAEVETFTGTGGDCIDHERIDAMAVE